MINIGLQLYTVRDECEKDFLGTLKKVAEIGYKGLEFCGYYDIKAAELREYIDKLGLKALCAHVPLSDMLENFEREIEYAKILGMKTISLPWLPEEYRKDRDAYLKTAVLLGQLEEKCSAEGIGLCYHNHDFEFETINNKYVLDIFIDKVPNLMLELDTFWTSFAGPDTLEYMKKNSSKLQYIHLKDMSREDKTEFVEVGEGCLDIASYVKTAVEIGVVWAFVEQDRCRRPSLESVKISYENLQRMIING